MLTAVAGYFALQAKICVAAAAVVVAVLASLMVSLRDPRPRRAALKSNARSASRRSPVRVVILAIGLIFAHGAGVGNSPELLKPAVYVPKRGAQRRDRRAAHLARTSRALGVTFAALRSSLLRRWRTEIKSLRDRPT